MSNVLPAHIEDAADDLWLWENLGTRNARTEKLETYNRMMRRRDVILTNNSNLCVGNEKITDQRRKDAHGKSCRVGVHNLQCASNNSSFANRYGDGATQ